MHVREHRDAQTGHGTLTFTGHTGAVRGVAFSPDGKRLASATGHHFGNGPPGEIKLWDSQTWRRLWTSRSEAGRQGPFRSAAFSPDAMTGLEANLRFAGPETMETKIFGRLTAWQNWIFQRPNAVGDKGALKVYGQQGRPEFDWKRT